MSMTHGLAGTYRDPKNGCRCPLCTKANTDRTRRERQDRATRLAADPSLAPHGSYTTYTNWGCRCAPCVKANSDSCHARKVRRRQSQLAVATKRVQT